MSASLVGSEMCIRDRCPSPMPLTLPPCPSPPSEVDEDMIRTGAGEVSLVCSGAVILAATANKDGRAESASSGESLRH
eukprot:9167495-Alexandrium_andersonii.AAC.1